MGHRWVAALRHSVLSEIKAASYNSASVGWADMGSVAEFEFSE
jgi:hypothetical protein